MSDLERLIAIEAIRACKFRYTYCLDNKDWANYATVFAKDVVVDERDWPIVRDPVTKEWVKTGKHDLEYLTELSNWVKWPVVGREAAVAMAQATAGPGRSFHKLFGGSVEITSPTTAKAIWPFEDEIYFAPGAPLAHLKGSGYYHETYQKTEEGWVIKTLWLVRNAVEIA
jgi:hypothetical protein